MRPAVSRPNMRAPPARAKRRLIALLSCLGCALWATSAQATKVAPNSYAWGENIGWLNALPLGSSGPGVDVTDTAVTGYMWGENVGWISLSCSNTGSCASGSYGVTVDPSSGAFFGYAWSENTGWIS